MMELKKSAHESVVRPQEFEVSSINRAKIPQKNHPTNKKH